MQIHGVVYINDDPCPVTNMFDINAEETTERKDVVTVVVQAGVDKWITMEVEPSDILWVQ